MASPGYMGIIASATVLLVTAVSTIFFIFADINNFYENSVQDLAQFKELSDDIISIASPVTFLRTPRAANLGGHLHGKCSACANQPNRCPRGPTGPRGKPGRKGPDAPDGIPGPDALNAYTWMFAGRPCFTCPRGPPGPRGEPGAEGPRGYPGRPGYVGRQGLHGHPGTHGARGDQGKPGEQGPPGKQGKQGGMGRIAANPAGPAGPPGNPGPPGKDGLPGDKGADGKRGSPGSPGIPGYVGEPGEDGTPGQPGERGDRGVSRGKCECPKRTPSTTPYPVAPPSPPSIRPVHPPSIPPFSNSRIAPSPPAYAQTIPTAGPRRFTPEDITAGEHLPSVPKGTVYDKTTQDLIHAEKMDQELLDREASVIEGEDVQRDRRHEPSFVQDKDYPDTTRSVEQSEVRDEQGAHPATRINSRPTPHTSLPQPSQPKISPEQLQRAAIQRSPAPPHQPSKEPVALRPQHQQSLQSLRQTQVVVQPSPLVQPQTAPHHPLPQQSQPNPVPHPQQPQSLQSPQSTETVDYVVEEQPTEPPLDEPTEETVPQAPARVPLILSAQSPPSSPTASPQQQRQLIEQRKQEELRQKQVQLILEEQKVLRERKLQQELERQQQQQQLKQQQEEHERQQQLKKRQEEERQREQHEEQRRLHPDPRQRLLQEQLVLEQMKLEKQRQQGSQEQSTQEGPQEQSSQPSPQEQSSQLSSQEQSSQQAQPAGIQQVLRTAKAQPPFWPNNFEQSAPNHIPNQAEMQDALNKLLSPTQFDQLGEGDDFQVRTDGQPFAQGSFLIQPPFQDPAIAPRSLPQQQPRSLAVQILPLAINHRQNPATRENPQKPHKKPQYLTMVQHGDGKPLILPASAHSVVSFNTNNIGGYPAGRRVAVGNE